MPHPVPLGHLVEPEAMFGAFMKSGQHLHLNLTASTHLGEWRDQLGVDYNGDAEEVPSSSSSHSIKASNGSNGSSGTSISSSGGGASGDDEDAVFQDDDGPVILPRSLDFSKWTVANLPSFQVAFTTKSILRTSLLSSRLTPLLFSLLQKILIHVGEMKEGEKIKDYAAKWNCVANNLMTKRAIDAWFDGNSAGRPSHT